MSLTKISKFIFHKHTIKIVSLIFVIGCVFVLPTFAQGTATTNTGLDGIKEGINSFLSVCSWLRVVLAILAGKLMTNDFVYGAFIHMDIYLRKIRNIMKNFANFALIGLVLVSIIKSLIGKEALDVKKIITNTLLAGILIQVSRFAMGALIDISTVATTGISSFPMSFLQSNTELQGKIKESLQVMQTQRVVFDPSNTADPVKTIEVTPIASTDQETRDSLLPSYDSVSGPFLFLGMSVFKFQNYLGVETSSDVQTLTFSFVLRLGILFFFTIGLLLLFVANIMRIGLLRIFIIGSPLLILMQVFKLKAGDKGLMKIFKFSNLIAIIFKPLIFVAGISLMFIVITSMQYGFGTLKRENNLHGVQLDTSSTADVSSMTVEGISSIEVSQKDLLGPDVIEQGQNVFSYLIELLLTLFLMWRFIKLSLTLGGGPIEDVMTKITGRAENIAKTTPILPIAGGASVYGMGKMMNAQKRKMAEGFGMDTKGRFDVAEQKFQNFIDQKWLGIKPSWTRKDINDLEKLIDQPSKGDFIMASINIAKNREGGLSLNNPLRREALEKWLKSDIGKKEMKNRAGTTQDFVFESFEKTFKDNTQNGEKYRQALHELLGGDKEAYNPSRTVSTGGGRKIDYDTLMSNIYYRDFSGGAADASTPPAGTDVETGT